VFPARAFGGAARVALVAATFALAACGGAGGSHALPRTAAGAVQVALTLPAVTASMQRRARYIAPSVRSGSFSVNAGTPQVSELTAGSPGCVTTTSGLTCTVTLLAPPGSDTFAVALYDGANATGALLGSGTAHVTIAAGTTPTVGITIGGVVASIMLALGNTVPVAGTPASIPLSVTALDADGNIIVADPFATPITLSDSDTSGITELSTTSLATPSTAVNVAYSGTTLRNATFSASVAGATPTVQTALLTPKTGSTDDWATFGFNAQRTGYNPLETRCCTSRPTLLWQRMLDPQHREYLTAEPIFADNVWVPSVAGGGAYLDLVYVADNHGNLYALDAATGNIAWSKTLGSQMTTCFDMPDKEFGITGTPLFDRASNRLYVADGAGKLWALDPASGNVAPGWPANGLLVVTNATLDHVYGALNLDTVHGIMPVPTASYCDDGHWTGALRIVDVNAVTVLQTFVFAQSPPAPAGQWGSGMWGMGGTSLVPGSGDIVGASGNAEPLQAVPYSNSWLRWSVGTNFNTPATFSSSDNVGDDDFGAIPSLFPGPDGKLCGGVEGKSGILYMFDSDAIPAGPTSNVHMGLANSDDYNSATPSYSPLTGKVYITTGFSGGALSPGLYAFTLGTGCAVASTPSWSNALGPTNFFSPTTIANGSVFVGVGSTIAAFRADTGAQQWSTTAGSRNIYAGITVIDGRLFTANWDGSVSAFTAPGVPGQSRARAVAR
jgi:hypothetical protein